MPGRGARGAGRTHEVLAFLVDVNGMASVDAEFNHSATYHDSCSGLRQLGAHGPRRLHVLLLEAT